MEKSMKWYNAVKIITVILAVLGCIGVFFSGIFSFVIYMFSFNTVDVEVPVFAGAMKNLTVYSSISTAIITVFYFLIYFGLKRGKKYGLYSIYAINALVPISILAQFPFMTEYFKQFFSYIGQRAGEISFPEIVFTQVAVASVLFPAVVSAVLLYFNSLYFYRRKDVFK